MREFFASCPKGIEYLLVDELKALGASDVREALAGVHFRGELAIGYGACLWSRLASRILMPLADFIADDADALYAGARSINWSAHLAPESTFAIDAHSVIVVGFDISTANRPGTNKSSIWSCPRSASIA